MNARRSFCALLMLLLMTPVWAHEHEPPAYRPPMLLTVHDAQVPSLQCTTLLASACAAWTEDTCELWVPQTGLAVAWSVASSLMTPDMILGHEAMHCWLHNFHGVLPWM